MSEEDTVVDDEVEAQPESKQLTLSAAYKRTAPFLQNSPRYCSLLRATTNFIFHMMQPLSLVDEPAFRNLLQVAEPRFQLPHCTHITTKVLPEAYSGVRMAVEKQLALASKCTITTDLWTSQHQQRSYMSLTVHFIADDFTLQSKCLQTLEVPQDHDAASLKDVLSSMFSDWKITDKVCGGISDNGSNIVNSFTLLNIDHYPCIAHTLQLAVNKGLKVARVQRIIARCKAIVSHFKRSTKETYKLREKQELLKLPQHMLVQDCVTRWGSTLSMLQRLIEQQTAISAVLVEGKDRHLMLEIGDWEVVEMLVELLKPFQQATTVMGAVRYPTLSTVMPLLYKLLTKTLKITQGDSATSKAVKQEIKKDLDDRYHKPAVERIINMATFLDPRYKELPFLDSYSKREIVDMVEEELISLESDSTNQELRTEEVVDDDLDPPVSKKKKGPISKLIGDLFEGQNSSGSSTCKASKELELYRAEQPVKDLDSDPLTWWKSRQSVYPLLCQLVKAVHCFVATSVPSERLFSSSGNIISSSRSRLTPEHADQLIFLFENKA